VSGTRVDKIIIFGNFQKKRVEICISVVKAKLHAFSDENTFCFLTIRGAVLPGNFGASKWLIFYG
jgi:hypothetical protein